MSLGRRDRAGGSRRRVSRSPRIWAVALMVASIFGLLLGRLGQVQLVQHPTTTAAVAALTTRSVVQPAVRGRILDAQGEPLVANTTSLAVTIQRKTLFESPDGGRALVGRLATALGLSADTLWDKTFLCGTPGSSPAPRCFNGSAYEPVPVAEHVDPTRALPLLEQPENYPGVGVVTESSRTFPAPGGVNAAHLLGYVDHVSATDIASSAGRLTPDEVIGRDGLESRYDDVLRGSAGLATVSIDPRGIVTGLLSSTAPTPGRDVVTHVSRPIQVAAEQALAQAVGSARSNGYAADSGAAVVLDVTNGAVVAAASYPTYDPAVWTGGISQASLDALENPLAGTPLVSRVTGAVMPPASTFKVVSTTAAAAMGVDLHGRYDCTSSVQVGDRAFANYESHDYGILTLQRNIEVSCDTIWYRFAYQSWLAQGGLSAKDDSADPFVAAARAYGLGAPTGVDLPGEVAGRIPDRAWKRSAWQTSKTQTCARAASGYPEVAATDPARADYLSALAVENCSSGWQYRAGDAVNLAIGQGDVAVTPLQLARVYAAVANGGTLWVPQVAAATQKQDGSDRAVMAPVAAGTVPLSPDTRAFLTTALQGVITTGTASGVFAGWPQADYPLAGKTGSAEVFGKQATSWFASFGPVTNPRYAVVVMVSQAGTGGNAAAPASRQIWQALRAAG